MLRKIGRDVWGEGRGSRNAVAVVSSERDFFLVYRTSYKILYIIKDSYNFLHSDMEEQ